MKTILRQARAMGGYRLILDRIGPKHHQLTWCRPGRRKLISRYVTESDATREYFTRIGQAMILDDVHYVEV